MSTSSDILTLAQWVSPAFPVGGFAYSHGLETAIHKGTVANAADLKDWLSDVLEYGSGRNECILLRAASACTTSAELETVNQTALAVSSSRERVLETQVQGGAFAQTFEAIWGKDKGTSRAGELPKATSGLCYPVAVGRAAGRMGIDVDLAAAMYLQAFASNLISAAIRAVPLGQTEGQHVLAALTPLCKQIAQDSRDTTLDDLGSTAFLSDIAAMHHETLQPRIFRS